MDRLISEQAVIDSIEFFQMNPQHFDFVNLIDDIKEIPSAEPKTGHWITKIKSDLRDDMWPTNPKCSECGGEPYYSNTIYNYKFCPYCGVKMVKPNMSENPTSSKDVIWYAKRNYSEIVVEPQERSEEGVTADG